MIVVKPKKLTRLLQPHLDRLPIFPLHRVQLFPRALLPLYVFEQRYRDLTAACLERGGLMAIAGLRPGFRSEYHGRPPVRSVAGVGRIVAHRRNEDGTYNILLVGLARVRIDSEHPPDLSFREVHARLLYDHFPTGWDSAETRQTLTALAKKLSTLMPDGGNALLSLSDIARTTGELADVLSSVLVSDQRLRLRLFASLDVSSRSDLVTHALAKMISDLQRPREGESN